MNMNERKLTKKAIEAVENIRITGNWFGGRTWMENGEKQVKRNNFVTIDTIFIDLSLHPEDVLWFEKETLNGFVSYEFYVEGKWIKVR